MSDLNRAMIIGRLGRDPEVRYTPDGRAVASFSLATTDKWRDKQTGEMRERTEWHRIVAFNRLGEICGEYLSRGKQVFIEGRLRTRSWEKDGITRYTTEIEATNMQMLGSRGDGMDGGRPGNYSDSGRAGNYSDSGRAGNYSDSGRAGNYSDNGRAGNYSDSGRGNNYSNEGGYQDNYPDGGHSNSVSNSGRQNDNAPDQGYAEPNYSEPPDDDIPF